MSSWEWPVYAEESDVDALDADFPPAPVGPADCAFGGTGESLRCTETGESRFIGHDVQNGDCTRSVVTIGPEWLSSF